MKRTWKLSTLVPSVTLVCAVTVRVSSPLTLSADTATALICEIYQLCEIPRRARRTVSTAVVLTVMSTVSVVAPIAVEARSWNVRVVAAVTAGALKLGLLLLASDNVTFGPAVCDQVNVTSDSATLVRKRCQCLHTNGAHQECWGNQMCQTVSRAFQAVRQRRDPRSKEECRLGQECKQPSMGV